MLNCFKFKRDSIAYNTSHITFTEGTEVAWQPGGMAAKQVNTVWGGISKSSKYTRYSIFPMSLWANFKPKVWSFPNPNQVGKSNLNKMRELQNIKVEEKKAWAHSVHAKICLNKAFQRNVKLQLIHEKPFFDIPLTILYCGFSLHDTSKTRYFDCWVKKEMTSDENITFVRVR